VSLEHLWAGWRADYLQRVASNDASLQPDATGSLFERILRLDDREGFVVTRGESVSVLLNAYPYAVGHLLVVPDRAVADLGEMNDEEYDELWRTVRTAVGALEAVYRCEGVNVGLNLGRAGGAGVPDHLHVHVVPRWSADTNFMTTVAGTRVLPETLEVTWEQLRAAWPAASTEK